jgi:hypothetical protein
LEREDRLFEACRILFGNDVELSSEFLCYLRDEGVTSAFRKRAMQVHPDKALVSGLSLQRCQDEFVSLKFACETLRRHIASREIRSRSFVSPAGVNTGPLTYPTDLPEEKLLFGRFLYRMGIIQWRQLITALAWQKSGRPRIGELGISLGYLDRQAVITILKNSVKVGAFGVTARNMGFLTTNEVRELLLRQKRQEKKIGQFFVEKGLLTRKELMVLLGQCWAHNRRMERLYQDIVDK